MASRALILFAAERAKNLGCPHGALFSNFQPEVPQKILWNPEKIDFFAKKYFAKIFFFPDCKNNFGPLPVRNLKNGHPKFFALSVAKIIRALAAIPKNLKNRTGRVKKKMTFERAKFQEVLIFHEEVHSTSAGIEPLFSANAAFNYLSTKGNDFKGILNLFNNLL